MSGGRYRPAPGMIGCGLVWLGLFLIRHYPRRSGPRRSRGRHGDEISQLEIMLAPAESERAVEAVLDRDGVSEHGSVGVGRPDLKAAALVSNGEVAGDHALLGVGEEAVEVGVRGQQAVGIDGADRSDGEALFPPRQEDIVEKAVRGGERANSSEPKLLDQPILESLEEALDATLRLRRERQDQF